MQPGQYPGDDRLDSELMELERMMRPRLAPYPVKKPTPEESRQLVQHLLQRAERQDPLSDLETRGVRRRMLSLGQFIRLQMGTYGWGFWAVSLVIFVLLTLSTTQMSQRHGESSLNLYAMILPGYVVAAAVYGRVSGDRGMRLVENTVPFPPALLWLIRILVVTGLNIAFGVLGTALLAFTVRGMPFLFLVHWLSAVFATGGLTAWVLFRRGVRPAIATGIEVWALAAVLQQPSFLGDTAASWGSVLLLVAGLAAMVRAGRRGYAMWKAWAGVPGLVGWPLHRRG
ncbi:hypothetical protein [Kyrpidia spormannii]|uniref:Uncharacterized protein n=1 Tax=Kyrpidia spormannii TaxID=2055160 RepID=A0ACA8Z5P2_9BACL|nr:hypothetical protein [Kyrpidia spormannii]CAB3390081.1 conserved membrane protein of unknown function [Kyrpidia spormannii]